MDNQILEELQRARDLVNHLTKEIDDKNQKLLEMECNLDKNFSMMMMEKASMQQAYAMEMKKMQFVGLQNVKLQQRVTELEKQKAQIDLEWNSLLIEREKEVIDKGDSKLKELRRMWGKEVYKAEADAMLELNEYNPIEWERCGS